MSVLPPDASLVEILEDCVSTFRERGIGLSPRNLALLSDWLELGIPAEVIARGIASYAQQARWDQRPGDALFFSLLACQSHVWRLWDHHRQTETGRTAPYQEGWSAELERVAQSRPDLREAALRLLRFWTAHPAATAEENRRRENVLPQILARALPYPQRRTLLQQALHKFSRAPNSWGWSAKPSRSFFRSATMRAALDLGVR